MREEERMVGRRMDREKERVITRQTNVQLEKVRARNEANYRRVGIVC